jgi:hypothetical protein
MRRRREAAVAMAALIVAVAAPAAAEPLTVLPATSEGDPPPGYHRESRSSHGLVIAGAMVFADSYLAAQVAGYLLSIPYESENLSGVHPYAMMVPVVGPIVFGVSDGNTEGLFVLNSASQLLGLTMMSVGFGMRHEVFRPDAALVVRPSTAGAGLAMEIGW